MKRIFIGFLLALGLAQGVFAAGSLTVAALDVSDFIAVAGAVLVAGAVMWSVRKALRLIGA
jgi:hypothetical protein